MTAGWSRVPGDDLADDALRMEAGRPGCVKSASCRAPHGIGVPGAALAGDLRILPGQPRRHGIGRRAEDHGDAALVRTVEHRLQPLEVEPAVLGLPGRPDRLADPDDGETGVSPSGPGRRPVTARAGTRGSRQHRRAPRRKVRHEGTAPYSLTAPADRPDCQYRCRMMKATISGMIDSRHPVTTRASSAALAPLAAGGLRRPRRSGRR